MRFAIVNKDTKRVVNCIIWEGAEFLPPKNHYVIQNDYCDIDDIWNSETNLFYKLNDDGTMIEKSKAVSI